MKDYVYSADQKIVRRNWMLVSMLHFFVWPLLILIMMSMYFGTYAGFQEYFFITLTDIVAPGIGFLILWHCAYRKNGYRYLRWIVGSGIVIYVLSLKKDFGVVDELPDPIKNWFIAGMILEGALYVWWIVCSVRLKDVNKNIKSLQEI